jgi:hypothetical protein
LPIQLSDFGFGLNEDPTLEVRSALTRTCLENLNRAHDAFLKARALGDPAAPLAAAELKTSEEFLGNFAELLDWLYPARKAMSVEEALTQAQSWQQNGVPSDFVIEMFPRLLKRDIGAPHKRELYIAAFELQLRSKDMSLGKVTRKLCPCGGEHGPKCEQNLKAGIRSLKRLLRKYAPDLLSRYEALHPDRAKKVNG